MGLSVRSHKPCKASRPRVGARRSRISDAYTAACSPYREGVGSVDLRDCWAGAAAAFKASSPPSATTSSLPPPQLVCGVDTSTREPRPFTTSQHN
jgi:hypothetical protein